MTVPPSPTLAHGTPAADVAAPRLVFPTPPDARDLAAAAALPTGAAWWPAPLAWCAVRGEQAALALNGLVTNDVMALPAGAGQRAVTLTPKGKVITDLLLLREDAGSLLVATPPSGMDPWLGILRKYVNPRLARAADERGARVAVMVAGARAAAMVAPVLAPEDAAGLASLPAWHHVAGMLGAHAVRVVAHPRWAQVPLFLLVTEAAAGDAVGRWLAAQGAVEAGETLGEWLRVEAGEPRLGADMDEGTIPQEANLDTRGAISFTKGCYTGQETVARVHFRGHVNRRLMGVRTEAPVPAGAVLHDAGGKAVGTVTSTVLRPTGGALALAMVRREVPEGGAVTVTWEADAAAHQRPATVIALREGGGAQTG